MKYRRESDSVDMDEKKKIATSVVNRHKRKKS